MSLPPSFALASQSIGDCFKAKYESAILHGNDKNASDRDKRIGSACQLYEAFLKSEIVLSAVDGSPLAALMILKKICDHPLLLTKIAAEDLLEEMETRLNQEDQGVAEKLPMQIAIILSIAIIKAKVYKNGPYDISPKLNAILELYVMYMA
ncbi:hypothetical protein L2E82_23080 [Cichorium intybus]|uniref:Uncharacterized protein n=1 Tax=Cichorium intybus TaxID=13427 RepID=A0ACB9E090_CICIN|nr:hypothetical protein L2E82_23080 [Cichorium intybus]